MNYERILEGILDIGEAMLCSGAENFRLDDTLYRMCKTTDSKDMMCLRFPVIFRLQ